jgi:hypothetical protein
MHGSAASPEGEATSRSLILAARSDRTRAAAIPALTEAVVVGVEGGQVTFRLASGRREQGEGTARVAVPGYSPAAGDRVLVQPIAETGALYVTGVVCAPRAENEAAPVTIVTPSGASATAEGDVLALRDAGGRVVATLDGRSGELCLKAGGDLRLSAPSGRVLVEAQSEVELRGAALRVDAAEARLSVGHWELRAERIVERTTDALRTVEGLLETRAKHARAIVSRTLELLSRRTTIVSEEDTRLDGKRVLLG